MTEYSHCHSPPNMVSAPTLDTRKSLAGGKGHFTTKLTSKVRKIEEELVEIAAFLFFFRGLSLRCFWCCNFLVWFDHSEMQDEHVAIILYICMIQALSYSLIFYRNLENRHPQFTDTACIVECFCIILFTSLDFPIKCFHKRLQGSAFIWSYLILICMEIFCSLFVPLTHLTTQSLRPCQKTIHLKTEILSKKKK